LTFAPADLLEIRSYLRGVSSLSLGSLGIVGDGNHTSGYHEGADNLAGRKDYSVRESPRDAHPTNAASALDISLSWPLAHELTLWLVAQCAAGAPDTSDIREIIYTPDRKTVKRWDRLKVRSGGDSSHLQHTHISFFRDSEGRRSTALFRRFLEERDMTSLDDTTVCSDGIARPYRDMIKDIFNIVFAGERYTLGGQDRSWLPKQFDRIADPSVLAKSIVDELIDRFRKGAL